MILGACVKLRGSTSFRGSVWPKCPRLSLTLSLIVLGFAGWLGMAAGWRFFSYCWDSSTDPVVVDKRIELAKWPWEYRVVPNESLTLKLPSYETISESSMTLVGTARALSQPVVSLFDPRLSFSGFCYFLCCTIWAILVWSIFGAAITRIAALALTRGHKLGLRGGLSFGLQRWPSYVGGPALPLIACLMLALPLMVLGWISYFDAGTFFVGLIWPLALIGGGMIALLALGLFLCWPLMWPTISTEVTDSFDALSRSYSYTLHRPLRYFGYVMFAGILGTLLLVIVSFLVSLVLQMTLWGFSIGAGIPRVDDLTSTVISGEQGAIFRGAHHLFAFWNQLLQLIPFAVAASYFWTAMTQIYLLLRRDEDGAELDEIFLPAQDQEFGLPPLKTDAAGVPTVAAPKPPAGNTPDDTALGS